MGWTRVIPDCILGYMADEWIRGEYAISTDPARLDIAVIHGYLSGSAYWAMGRPLEMVRRSIQHSLPFGVYKGSAQIGFARVATDYATFAWLADVFVLPEHQGQGLGKWLIGVIVDHPGLPRTASLDTGHEGCTRSLRSIRFHAAARAGTVYGAVRGLACPEARGPSQQRSRGSACRHHRGVPNHHMQCLQISAVKLQHGHPGQACKCAYHQSGGNGIHRKTTP